MDVRRAALLLLAGTASVLAACDVRRVVRTTVRSSRGEVISESCIQEAFSASDQRELKQQDDSRLAVISRTNRPSLNLDIAGDGTSRTISLLATVLVGTENELARAHAIEDAEPEVATAIVSHCAPHGVLSCWDSKTAFESAECFP